MQTDDEKWRDTSISGGLFEEQCTVDGKFRHRPILLNLASSLLGPLHPLQTPAANWIEGPAPKN